MVFIDCACHSSGLKLSRGFTDAHTTFNIGVIGAILSCIPSLTIIADQDK